MRAALLGCLVAGGACWSAPPATAPIAQTTPALPALPAPAIAWQDNGFVDRLLPAIATDGSRVVLGITDPDSARGNPNYRIEVRGRDDKLVSTHEVLTVGDVDSGAFFDETGVLPALRQRIAAGNAHLAELHAAHRLVPLKKLTLERDDDAPLSAQTAHGGNVVVAWTANRVVVTDERGDGKTVIVDRPAPAAWLARPTTSATHSCENPAYLGDTWVALDQRLLVITVEYEGTDICWEPDAQLHVLTW